MDRYDVLIVGAGVIGGMLARELSRYRLRVCILEKENDVAMGASKANSGIIHGGYDPEPGTVKARMNTEGVPLLYDAAEALQVPYRRNGSMVCAFSPEEEATLEELLRRGHENGVEGLRILTGDEARCVEPALSAAVTAALHVPTGGIICPYSLTVAAVGCAMDNGVDLLRNFEVIAIQREADWFSATGRDGRTARGRFLVNCAGCASDGVARMAGDEFFTIIPRAGEYVLLDRSEGATVGHTVFQVPTAEGKGILVTPTAHGNLLLGPTASRVENPEDTATTAGGLDTVRNLAKKSVPGLDVSKTITTFAGVRSSEKNGDFIIHPSERVPGLLHCAAIDSPGLTSSVAIARHCVKLLAAMGLSLSEKEHWNGTRPRAYSAMTEEEKNEVIGKDPDFGRIVCRCEGISAGEIRWAIRQNPGARDVDGVKRRTRGGMGRCHGGFCSPSVLKILAEELNLPPEEITKCGDGSNFLMGER